MSLTRKHFKALADIIKQVKKESQSFTIEQVIEHLEDNITIFCSHHNPNFNYQKFKDACENPN